MNCQFLTEQAPLQGTLPTVVIRRRYRSATAFEHRFSNSNIPFTSRGRVGTVQPSVLSSHLTTASCYYHWRDAAFHITLTVATPPSWHCWENVRYTARFLLPETCRPRHLFDRPPRCRLRFAFSDLRLLAIYNGQHLRPRTWSLFRQPMLQAITKGA